MINEAEIKSIIQKLIENADDFRFLKFSQVNFRHEFGLHGEVITPIGIAFMDYDQFNKVDDKLRKAYFGLIKPTLEKPLLIIKHRERLIFLKTFNSKKEQSIFFVGVAQEKDGEFSLVSGHSKTLNNIKNKLKEGNIIYQTDSLKPQSHLGNTQPKPPYYVSLTMGINFSITKIQKKDTPCQVLSGINLQKARARIYAFQHIISLYPDYVGFLRNGTIPDEEAVKEDFEILENEYFGKADADNETPLTFTELCSYNTWFYLHPGKIAGKEYLTTSREFPVTIKGTQEDIISTIKAGMQSNPDKEKRIRIAKAKAAAKLKLLNLAVLNGTKLSAYTIAANCTDVRDLEDGIQEIRDLMDYRTKRGLKVPDYYYIRLAKLKEKLKLLDKSMNGNISTGDFGPIYTQFKNKPKEAIKHLKKVQEGECFNALYREDIGYIDIVWGENDENNKGFGLKHIIEKHGKEIKEMGFNVEDFLILCVETGAIKAIERKDKIYIKSKMFRIIIKTKWNGKKKTLLLSGFDLRYKNENQ